jgi:hypothetical protein
MGQGASMVRKFGPFLRYGSEPLFLFGEVSLFLLQGAESSNQFPSGFRLHALVEAVVREKLFPFLVEAVESVHSPCQFILNLRCSALLHLQVSLRGKDRFLKALSPSDSFLCRGRPRFRSQDSSPIRIRVPEYVCCDLPHESIGFFYCGHHVRLFSAKVTNFR